MHVSDHPPRLKGKDQMTRTLLLLLALTAPAPALAVPTGPACPRPATAAPVRVEMNQLFQLPLGGPSCDCAAPGPLSQVNLLVKGIDTGMHPLSCDPATGALSFKLSKDAATAGSATVDAAWQAMLGDFWAGNGGRGERQLNYTLTQGQPGETALLGSGRLALLTWDTGAMLLGIALLLAVWVPLFLLSKLSGMVRDPGAATAHCPRSYSLARVQMAWWFAIVIGAYIFLWAITREMPALSAQALALLGLSSATGLTAAGLDAGQQKGQPCGSGRFFIDLLTDADGITIYRFQLLVSNVLFGLFFLISVLRNLCMPEFDSSVLTLLGISGATYNGFKIPERHGPPASAAAAPAPAPVPGLP